MSGDAAHDAQLAERYRKAEAADRHDVTHTQTVTGPTIANDNRTQIATPVAVVAIVCFFVAGILGGLSLGVAFNANDKSGQARMEARLAQEDLIMLRAAVKAHGIHVDTAQDHD